MSFQLTRRSLVLGVLAAPAIVRAESLMRLAPSSIWVPPGNYVFHSANTESVNLVGRRFTLMTNDQLFIYVESGLFVPHRSERFFANPCKRI